MKTVQRALMVTALIGLTGAAMQAQAYSTPRGNCQPGYAPHPYYGPYGQPMPPAYRAPMMRPPMRPMPYPQRYRQPMQRPPVQQQPAMQPSAQQTQQSEKPAVAMDSASVSISQMQFVPARVVVKKGGTVTWNQADTMPHTVTSRDGSFASQQLGANQSFSQVFDKPGTYSYYCSLHPSMQAVVEVVE
ncbi:MAG: plastocyanin/azurin family copper-binding protein [Chromatiales bacterium]